MSLSGSADHESTDAHCTAAAATRRRIPG